MYNNDKIINHFSWLHFVSSCTANLPPASEVKEWQNIPNRQVLRPGSGPTMTEATNKLEKFT